MTIAEAAEALGQTEGTIKSRLHRGRLKMERLYMNSSIPKATKAAML